MSRPVRLASAFALILSIAPTAGWAQTPEQSASKNVFRPPSPAERRIDLLKASVEAAGGSTVDVASHDEPLGGYVYPLLALDLDGDGNDEVLLDQWASGDFIVAVDDAVVLWRERVPRRSYLIGAVPGDLFPEEGDDVLLIFYRWRAEKIVLAGASQTGMHWRTAFDDHLTELNGLVEADRDEQQEIALTVRDEDTDEISIATYDGAGGFQLWNTRSTFERTVGGSWIVEAFVTDGPTSSSDEAVFITSIPVGLFAERIDLVTGRQTAVNVLPNSKWLPLIQGPDYTGDGKRDATTGDWFLWGPLSADVAVFDPSTLSFAWRKTLRAEPNEVRFARTYQAGDANGDNGEDFCFDEFLYVEDAPSGPVETFSCWAGSSGAELWRISSDLFESTATHADLNGDHVKDLVTVVESYECDENANPPCRLTIDARATSGKDGSPLWSSQDATLRSVPWTLAATDLDGIAGDDILLDEEPRGPGAPFSVRNGLSLAPSWRGAFDPVEGEGYTTSVIGADLDGDGAAEPVVAAVAYKGIGEPTCETWEGQEYCWYDYYEEFAHLGAFRTDGARIWQMRL